MDTPGAGVVEVIVVDEDIDTDTDAGEAVGGDPSGRRRVPIRLALAAALALVVVVRLPTVFDVFRDDWVVLVSNDPYFYRYLVDQSLAGGPIPSLPARAVAGEPLLVATLATATTLLGGSTWASGFVLAWYPVVAAVVTAGLVYGIAVRVSGDVRVGLASAGLLAVTPAHAYRTALGVADHHAFDYVWLALTVLVVVDLLTRHERDRRTWLGAGVLAVAVAAQTLSWEAAPSCSSRSPSRSRWSHWWRSDAPVPNGSRPSSPASSGVRYSPTPFTTSSAGSSRRPSTRSTCWRSAPSDCSRSPSASVAWADRGRGWRPSRQSSPSPPPSRFGG
ncbi:STT3 domain-containing protein [Haloplanus litoreus]|uniref:STT3 domain-containing protein n=1 Tax=Haloplanus litoreus TaxID=767515 RepID=UPI003615EFF9